MHLELSPRGPFSLQAAAEFGFGPTAGRTAAYDGAMRLAFPLDGGTGYAGAVLRQPGGADAPVTVELTMRDPDPDPDPDPDTDTDTDTGADTALRQIARIVSLDHDGEEFLRVGERDPIIGELQRRHPGQRPVLFHSPYEAAAWAIISARRPSAQAAHVRAAISHGHGSTFTLAGQTLHAFPQPGRLHGLPDDTPGVNPQKVDRLRALADAAETGALDVERLQALGPEEAHVDVQKLNGIGPFYATLIVVRATGFADALLQSPEPRLFGHLQRLYDLAGPPTLEELTALAEPWRPFRTWCTVLIRLANDRSDRSDRDKPNAPASAPSPAQPRRPAR